MESKSTSNLGFINIYKICKRKSKKHNHSNDFKNYIIFSKKISELLSYEKLRMLELVVGTDMLRSRSKLRLVSTCSLKYDVTYMDLATPYTPTSCRKYQTKNNSNALLLYMFSLGVILEEVMYIRLIMYRLNIFNFLTGLFVVVSLVILSIYFFQSIGPDPRIRLS